ncbi:hypothetical protein AG1IA_09494 [Rhizoctonia solani AG-1 IA]|uniref:Uncharacterized protein n=1 Tax=Thanatephorus cucumeris (strain AG1-IA) TaxID=983506 RepID=L8WE66_THACA|nr:hypothetical protein AG1IA_09494 [Rhizoctonia solani AG-1 IA]
MVDRDRLKAILSSAPNLDSRHADIDRKNQKSKSRCAGYSGRQFVLESRSTSTHSQRSPV